MDRSTDIVRIEGVYNSTLDIQWQNAPPSNGHKMWPYVGVSGDASNVDVRFCEDEFCESCSTDQSQCSSCLPGATIYNGLCTQCPSGTFNNGGTCQACDANCQSDCSNSAFDCSTCISGYVHDGTQCVECVDGTFVDRKISLISKRLIDLNL